MATATTKGTPVEHANGNTTMTEAIENNVKGVEKAAAKAGNMMADWMRKLPLASLGLVAVIGDETKDFASKLFMSKLVERGELLQKDAEQRMKDMQARFR